MTTTTVSPEQPRTWKQRRSSIIAALGLLPFGVYTILFLGVPALAVVVGAFQSPTGGWTWSNISIASHGVYAHGFVTTIELALVTSIVPGLAGVVIAYAVLTMKGNALRRIVSTASGVFANFGGVPLAFLFIATLGTTGIVTSWLNTLGIDPYQHGFTLFSFIGVSLVYAYFQIPLMILVITPALEGLRPSWREAAEGMGARSWEYWRFVGGPVLFPSFLGGVLLLFGSALSAYATAEALTSGSIALTSIQIGSFLNGNVLAGQQNVGKALGFGLIVVIAVVMVGYSILQRRSSKWLH
ncbi:MAG TPA: ABC transporter permease subunit [Acidimicrobiales bacterium]|nr:ABC transporter permease subunit [Acidimicrobiales bacterium]